MGKLIRNDLYNLVRNLAVWAGLVFLAFVMWIQIYSQLDQNGKMGFAQDIYIIMANIAMYEYFFIIIYGAIVPFIVGWDFDGGMFRSKILAGFSKTQIYFSNLIVSLIAILSLNTLYLLLVDILCIREIGISNFFHLFNDSHFAKLFIDLTLHEILIAVVTVCFSCALTMVITKKAIAIVAVIGIAFVSGVINPLFGIRYYVTETEPYMTYTNYEGVRVTQENMFYLEPNSPEKKIVTVLDSMDVVGQTLVDNNPYVYAINWDNAKHETYEMPARYNIGLLADAVLCTAAGIFVFNKRNLK